MPIKFLSSKNLFLSPIEDKDREKINEWYNDPLATHFLYLNNRPYTLDDTKDLMDLLGAESNVSLGVYKKEGEELVGLAGLYNLDPISRKAEIEIVFGDKQVWGTSLAAELAQLMTYYGFAQLNLNKITTYTLEDDRAGQGAYDKSGYKKEGILKQDIYKHSVYHNTLILSILREDYFKDWHTKHKKDFS